MKLLYKLKDEILQKTITDDQNIAKTRQNLNALVHKYFFKSIIIFLIALLMISFEILLRIKPDIINLISINYNKLIFPAINLALFIFCVLFSFEIILQSISKLVNHVTGIEIPIAFCLVFGFIQNVLAIFFSSRFFPYGVNHLYTALISIVIFCYYLSEFYNLLSVRKNYNFFYSTFKKFTVKLLNDKQSKNFTKGMNIKKPKIAFKDENTKNLKDLNQFYEKNFIPYKALIVILSFILLISIISCILSKNIFDILNSSILLLCAFIPFSGILAINIKKFVLVKKSLKIGAAITNLNVVKKFSKINILLLDACDIYPKKSVNLKGIKTFGNKKLDKALLCTEAVCCKINSPLKGTFEQIIMGRLNLLPKVESVFYEENNGVVSWIDGKRILIGNRSLMQKYGVSVLSLKDEEKYLKNRINCTYFSYAGELVAAFMLDYIPDMKIQIAMKNLEKLGIKLIVKTSDPNITPEKIAEDFCLYSKNIKVIPFSSNMKLETTDLQKDMNDLDIIIRDKLTSFSGGITKIISAKNNINFIILIELIAILISTLIVLLLVLYSSVSKLGQLEFIIYSLFWLISLIFIALISKY